jgi:hypothetical protein
VPPGRRGGSQKVLLFSLAPGSYEPIRERRARSSAKVSARQFHPLCHILAAEVEMADALVRFLEKATEDPGLFEELIQLAAKYGIDLTELGDDQLGDVSGGADAGDVKTGYESARELYKRSLRILSEHAERQTQVIQKLSS